mmetsp:Transcript_27124/g.40166  ORF Transcript_27124/g.40166 Transcript_27124/m.40166 type:complete len:334 (+) Transcript_27124:53-1054(+)
MLSYQLFATPPTGFVQLLTDVFTIFLTHWQPLVAIALFQILSFFGACYVLYNVTNILFANTIAQIIESYSGYSRHYYDYNGDANNAAAAAAEVSIFALGLPQLLAIYCLWAIVLSLVSSIYTGAMTHAIADIYAGNSPSISLSIGVGWAHKWKIYLFSLLLSFALAAVLFVTIGISMSFGSGVIVELVVFFIVLTVLVGTLMLGAVPSIVVEGKSPIEAFFRSWNLCKSHVCFIFCSCLGFWAVIDFVMVFIYLILYQFPVALTAFNIVVSVGIMPIGTILVFALYMSIRIRSENLTQQMLTQELSNGVPVANAVPASGYQKIPELAGEATIV